MLQWNVQILAEWEGGDTNRAFQRGRFHRYDRNPRRLLHRWILALWVFSRRKPSKPSAFKNQGLFIVAFGGFLLIILGTFIEKRPNFTASFLHVFNSFIFIQEHKYLCAQSPSPWFSQKFCWYKQHHSGHSRFQRYTEIPLGISNSSTSVLTGIILIKRNG